MKHKAITLLTAVCLALSTAACQPAQIDEDKSEYYIFATPLAEHPIWKSARKGFFDACQELSVHGDWLGPAIIDVKQMENVIQTGVLQKADGIITQGVVDPDVLQEARRNGIPVVLVDSDMGPEDRLCFLGKNFHEQAVLLLEDIEKRLGKDEHLQVAIQAANLDFQIALDQIQEVRDVFSTHPGGYEIVSISQSLSDELRARKEWEEVFDTNHQINVAINFAGESGYCCWDVAALKGLEKEILIYGVDDIEQTLDYVREGKMTGTVVTSFYQYGYQSLMIIDSYRKNRTAPSIASVSLELLTQESLKGESDEQADE